MHDKSAGPEGGAAGDRLGSARGGPKMLPKRCVGAAASLAGCFQTTFSHSRNFRITKNGCRLSSVRQGNPTLTLRSIPISKFQLRRYRFSENLFRYCARHMPPRVSVLHKREIFS